MTAQIIPFPIIRRLELPSEALDGTFAQAVTAQGLTVPAHEVSAAASVVLFEINGIVANRSLSDRQKVFAIKTFLEALTFS